MKPRKNRTRFLEFCRYLRTLHPSDVSSIICDNRIEAQFTALRYFALDGTGHPSHQSRPALIRAYIIWRNNHAHDERLRRILDRANVA